MLPLWNLTVIVLSFLRLNRMVFRGHQFHLVVTWVLPFGSTFASMFSILFQRGSCSTAKGTPRTGGTEDKPVFTLYRNGLFEIIVCFELYPSAEAPQSMTLITVFQGSNFFEPVSSQKKTPETQRGRLTAVMSVCTFLLHHVNCYFQLYRKPVRFTCG